MKKPSQKNDEKENHSMLVLHAHTEYVETSYFSLSKKCVRDVRLDIALTATVIGVIGLGATFVGDDGTTGVQDVLKCQIPQWMKTSGCVQCAQETLEHVL